MSDRFFKGWFAFVAVLSLGFLGLMSWGVVMIVNWLVTK